MFKERNVCSLHVIPDDERHSMNAAAGGFDAWSSATVDT